MDERELSLAVVGIGYDNTDRARCGQCFNEAFKMSTHQTLTTTIRTVTDDHGAIWHFLQDWQTLITGLLGLALTGFAVWFAWGSLQATRDGVTAAQDGLARQQTEAEDRRARRLRAARASLPGVLSDICEHAWDAGKRLNAAWPAEAKFYPSQVPMAAGMRVEVDIPALPQHVHTPLQVISEHADDQLVIERIASLLREAQVLNARTREWRAGALTSLNELVRVIIEAAALYARAESLFGYARQNTQTVDSEPLWERVRDALKMMGIDRVEVSDRVDRDEATGFPPGEGDPIRSTVGSRSPS